MLLGMSHNSLMFSLQWYVFTAFSACCQPKCTLIVHQVVAWTYHTHLNISFLLLQTCMILQNN